MKTVLKILGYTVLVALLLLGIGAAYIYFKGVPSYPYDIPDAIAQLNVPKDSASVARGAKIASLLCKECHRDFETGKMTGHIMTDMPKEFGAIASLNITQDPDHGIGTWTDGEIYYYLRRSIRKDGHYNPIMGGYGLMADEDIKSVIAWLRSDDPSLAPDPREYPPNQFNFLVKFLCNTVFTPPALPAGPINIPDSTDQIAFGKYVADALCGCFACHSADFKTMDAKVPERSEGYYGGGNPMLNYEGELVPSANLTMDKETGVGNWTKEQFREATQYCKKPDGTLLAYPMFPHTTLSDTEVDAIWAYLQTVPVLKNPVPRYQSKG
ncbi:MAG: c-type cytochrome [Saprospiraceae bacterium]|nr:c-type cytochrome [Saprospiraceae bacterium]